MQVPSARLPWDDETKMSKKKKKRTVTLFDLGIGYRRPVMQTRAMK